MGYPSSQTNCSHCCRNKKYPQEHAS